MNETLGEWLRHAREDKGYTLEDIERATRIRAKHLAALEADDFASLPSEAQVRGFLRNYAQFLGLQPDEVVAGYDAARHKGLFPGLSAGRSRSLPSGKGVRTPSAPSEPDLSIPAADPDGTEPNPQAALPAAPPRGPLPARPAPVENMGRAPQIRSRRPRLFSADVFFAVVVTLAIVLLMLWGGSQLGAGLAASATMTATRALAAGGTLPAVTITPLPAEPTPTPEPPTPAAIYSGVNISVRAEQRAWVSVVVDGAEQFAGLLAPGQVRDFAGQTVVEVTTGNGRGTRVIWNGRDQGTLGAVGEVIIRLWTVDGMITPTPTISPTPSQTPRPN